MKREIVIQRLANKFSRLASESGLSNEDLRLAFQLFFEREDIDLMFPVLKFNLDSMRQMLNANADSWKYFNLCSDISIRYQIAFEYKKEHFVINIESTSLLEGEDFFNCYDIYLYNSNLDSKNYSVLEELRQELSKQFDLEENSTDVIAIECYTKDVETSLKKLLNTLEPIIRRDKYGLLHARKFVPVE